MVLPRLVLFPLSFPPHLNRIPAQHVGLYSESVEAYSGAGGIWREASLVGPILYVHFTKLLVDQITNRHSPEHSRFPKHWEISSTKKTGGAI